jgi:hypothetical protein
MMKIASRVIEIVEAMNDLSFGALGGASLDVLTDGGNVAVHLSGAEVWSNSNWEGDLSELNAAILKGIEEFATEVNDLVVALKGP